MTSPDEHGFTLLELVFAMVLLSIGIAALLGVLATSFRSTAVDIHRTDATAIAGQGLAELEAAPVTGPLPSVNRNGQTYTVAGTVTPVAASNGAADAYLTAAVTVRWTDAAGPHSVVQSTAFFTPPPTTAAASTCTALGAVAPVVATQPGDPSLDVSWAEPPGGPVARWEVQLSLDGSTWTTAVADEPPLAPGATHQLEIGGLAPSAAYQVQVVATTVCGGTDPFLAAAPTTASVASTDCLVGSMTFGPAIGERVTSGAAAGTLTSNVAIVVTTPGSCASGLLAFVDTGDGIVTAGLAQSGTNSYVGTLPGLTQVWGLGVHAVTIYEGATAAGSGALCVEEQGAGTC
jgi:prepilin-type N-terminal cleavage/methylation domain-containing protein